MSDTDTAVAYILQGDPTVTGWQLPIGAFGYSFTTSKLYIKTGGDPTNWTEAGGGGSSTSAANSVKGNNTNIPATTIDLTVSQQLGMLGIGQQWAASELLLAQQLLGPTVKSPLIMAPGDMVAGSINAGTVTYSELGTVVATTANSAALFGHSTWRTAAGVKFMPPSTAGGKFYTSFGFKLVGASDSQSQFRIGLSDGVTNFEFQLIGSTSTTIWHAVGNRGGSAFNIAGTGAGATADFTAYHRFAIWSDSTTYHFAVDGVDIATSSAISAGLANAMTPQVLTYNGSNALNRAINLEQFFSTWVPLSP